MVHLLVILFWWLRIWLPNYNHAITSSYLPRTYVYGRYICYIATQVFTQVLILTKGIQVDYAARIADFEPGPANVRCLLLCWTGDHPAQCEVGKFLGAGGVSACRRDKVQGTK